MKVYKDLKSKKDQDNSFEIPEMFLDNEIFNNLDSMIIYHGILLLNIRRKILMVDF